MIALGLCACSQPTPTKNKEQGTQEAALVPETNELFRVENWFGKWTGVRPAYPLLNSNGEVIVVNGKEAKVAQSTFVFTIDAMSYAELVQSHDDGRVAAFSGTWKGRIAAGTNELAAIVCDLTANSTGAYRQFALVADDDHKAVMCHGTSAAPFEVQFSTH